MSYKKWWGGYFYGSWKPKKEEKKEEGEKYPSSPSYKDSRYSYYGGRDYEDYYDGDEVDYDKVYRNRYKSSLGYSGLGGGLLGSSYYSSVWSGSSSYCSARIGSGKEFNDLSQLLIKATKEARDLIVILDFPFRIAIKFNKESWLPKSGYREIFIPTNYFGDESRSAEEKVQIFCSLAINEAAHLKYTEYKIYKSFMSSLEFKLPSSEDFEFIRTLFEIIEDERVEDLLLKERPGYLDLIEKEKLYQYSEFTKVCSEIKDSAASSFLINLYKLIRFPKNIDEDVITEYGDLYETIGSIISPLPDSTKSSCIAVKKVYDEIIKILSGDRFKIPRSMINALFDKINEAASRGTSRILSGVDQDSCSISSVRDSEILDSLRDETTASTIEGMCDGSVTTGKKDKNTFFTAGKADAGRYDRDKREITPYIPGIRKLISGYDKNFEFNVFGCRSGLLDTTKLAEAYQGVPQVYVRKGYAITNKLAVCVLIDESGSMGWEGRKMKAARQAAILLNEALKDVPGVELYIYGHSGDELYNGSTEITVYREGKTEHKFSLGSSNARCENRDGVAIYETVRRVREQTESHILMFVISDGQPSAVNYRGWSAVQDTKTKVHEAQKLDTDIVQISIDYVPDAKVMFDNYIDISGDVSNMSKNLAGVIKRLIVKNKKTVIVQ